MPTNRREEAVNLIYIFSLALSFAHFFLERRSSERENKYESEKKEGIPREREEKKFPPKTCGRATKRLK